MKTIEEMLRSLAKADVTEFAVVSDRLPCVRQSGAFLPIDDTAPNSDTILEMLVSAGGSRYVDSLGPKPVQWTLRVEGVGSVNVTALMKDDIVQARFVVGKRDAAAPPKRPPPPRVPREDEGPPSSARGAAAEPRPPPPKHVARPDVDPRARGGNLSPPPPPPAAAAALADREPEFDFDVEPIGAPISSAKGLEFDALPQAPELGEPEREPPVSSGRAPQQPVLAPAPPPVRAPAPVAAAPARHIPVVGGARAVSGQLEQFLRMARGANASDLHVVPERPLLVRVAGELVPTGDSVDAALVERLAHGIVPERLRPTLETDGSCDFAVTDAAGRCRVNVSKQRTGLKICIRLIPDEVPTLESLGLPAQIADATHHHQGLILVTGPTGHGKTSTLAAIVDIINRETTKHVITVEDPVEYVHPRKRAMMSQREVGTNTRTFASALKGSLREDPDVIVVGELRDTETVRMALSASETGHLMIGTMNTPSAAKTIDRLIDLFPPSDQGQVRLSLAGGLRLIVSQRLLPNADHTGLVAACEILPGSVSLWSLIRDNKTYQIPSLQQRGKGLGIIRFDDSLGELVKAGRTSLEIAKQWAESPEEVEMTALNKRPVAVNPMAQQGKPMGEGAREAMAGILGKAGNLFRKGG